MPLGEQLLGRQPLGTRLLGTQRLGKQPCARTGPRRKACRISFALAPLLFLALWPFDSSGQRRSNLDSVLESTQASFAEAADALGLVSLRWRAVEWPELTVRAREQLADELAPDAYRRLSGFVSAEFDLGRLSQATTTALTTRENAANIRTIAAYYRAEPGAGLSADRASAFDGVTLAGFPSFAAVQLFQPERLQTPGSKQRRELLVQLGRSLGLANNVLTVAGAISGSLRAGAFHARCQPPPRRFLLEARESVEWARPLVEGRVRLALDFAHRERDLVSLSRELRFAKSPQGRRALSAVASALALGVEESASRVVAQAREAWPCDP